jgi:hypothetical protein
MEVCGKSMKRMVTIGKHTAHGPRFSRYVYERLNTHIHNQVAAGIDIRTHIRHLFYLYALAKRDVYLRKAPPAILALHRLRLHKWREVSILFLNK